MMPISFHDDMKMASGMIESNRSVTVTEKIGEMESPFPMTSESNDLSAIMVYSPYYYVDGLVD